MFKVLPKLTKEYILDRITQEKIMEFYLNIPVIDSNFLGNAFCNPFRKDNNPTCNYYFDDNHKLRVRDFGGDYTDRLYNMDVFDVVGHIYNINSNDKQGFKIIQNIIAKDFKIHKYADSKEDIKEFELFLTNQKSKEKRIKQIKVVPRKWNKVDEHYWYKRYGISSTTLKRFRVYPVEEAYVEDSKGFLNRMYYYNANNPCYAYYGGKVQELHIWKLYFPMNKGTNYRKMITNKQISNGFQHFLPTRIGVLTKSLKDVMALYEFGVYATEVPTETTLLTADQMFMFLQYCDIGVSLFDYDETGIRLANKAKKLYNLEPLMFTKGRYGKPNYGVKDFSDFREKYGKDTTLKIIKSTIDHLSYRIDAVNIERENLQWIYSNLKL